MRLFVSIFFCCSIYFLMALDPGIALSDTAGTLQTVESEVKGSAPGLYNFLTIHELNERNPQFGTYHVSGYVVKIYSCPPCPKGALCKPCQENYVIISEENKPQTGDDLTERELIIFTENTKRFETGRQYMFLIQVLDVKTVDQKINNIKLIYFEPINPAGESVSGIR